MLFVNRCYAPTTFPFCISTLNLNESFSMFIDVLVDGSLSCMVLLSFMSISVFFLVLSDGLFYLVFYLDFVEARLA